MFCKAGRRDFCPGLQISFNLSEGGLCPEGKFPTGMWTLCTIAQVYQEVVFHLEGCYAVHVSRILVNCTVCMVQSVHYTRPIMVYYANLHLRLCNGKRSTRTRHVTHHKGTPQSKTNLYTDIFILNNFKP